MKEKERILMRQLPFYRKLIIFTSIILILTITIVTFILVNRNNNTQDVIAKEVLTITFGLTRQDCEGITDALKQSSDSNNVLLDYLHTKYNTQLTGNGYEALMNNRIPTRIAGEVQGEASDLKVSSVKLKSLDADAGTMRYQYILKAETKSSPPKVFTFSGNILLIRDAGQWKVDGISLK